MQAAIIDLLKKGNDAQGPSSSELKLSSTKPAVVLVVGVNGSGKVSDCGLCRWSLYPCMQFMGVVLLKEDVFLVIL